MANNFDDVNNLGLKKWEKDDDIGLTDNLNNAFNNEENNFENFLKLKNVLDDLEEKYTVKYGRNKDNINELIDSEEINNDEDLKDIKTFKTKNI